MSLLAGISTFPKDAVQPENQSSVFVGRQVGLRR